METGEGQRAHAVAQNIRPIDPSLFASGLDSILQLALEGADRDTIDDVLGEHVVSIYQIKRRALKDAGL